MLKVLNHANFTQKQYIKFRQNPLFGSRDNMLKSYFGRNLTCQSAGVTLKIGQGHQNLINSYPPPSSVSMQVLSKFTNWFRRWYTKMADFYSLYSMLTLKSRSRSPKSNQLFIVSQLNNI